MATDLYDDILSPYDSPTAFGNEELMGQAARLARRKALLEADAIAAAKQTGRFAPGGGVDVQQPGSFRSAVTGAEIVAPMVKRPLLDSLSPLIADTAHGFEQQQFERDESGYNRMEREAARRVMDEMPRTQEAPGPYGVAVKTEPTPAEKMAWAQRASLIPSLKNLADAYKADLLIKEPEREEARAERVQTRADAIAEARRKQQEELEYRRQRDQEANELRREIAEMNDRTRREVQAAIHASRGGDGADKAANWKQETAEDGSISYYNVVTGERKGSGGQGKPSAQFAKDRLETRNQSERSQEAVDEAPRVKELLQQASGSGLKHDVRAAYNYVMGGKSAPLEADAALAPIADKYLKSVPRFEGPQSDADTKSYKEAAGQLANTKLSPEVRAAAHAEVVRLHQKSLKQMAERSSFSGDVNARKRDNAGAVGSSGGRSLTFNPATGKLE